MIYEDFVKEYRLEPFQSQISQSKNPEWCYWFACLDNDKDGRLSCWLLLEAENLTEKQKNRIVGNLMERDTENQYLPFVSYILGISPEELEDMKNNHKIVCGAEVPLDMDR